MKVAINVCFGGFSVSREVVDKLRAKGFDIRVVGEYYRDGSGPIKKWGDDESYHLGNDDFRIIDEDYNKYRSHPALIKAIEESSEPSARFSEIRIVEIPDDADWEIDEYDGNETIREKSRSWR